MQEPQTCGNGLAENAVLPAHLGATTAAMAEVLEVHTRALDMTDPNAKAEHDAYTRLVGRLRESAATLRATADQMAACRDLPMGSHDEQAMLAPEPVRAFEQFVQAKQRLLAVLQRQSAPDQQMLVQMREAT